MLRRALFGIATFAVIAACSGSSSQSSAESVKPTLEMKVHVPAGTEQFACQYFSVSDARTYASKVSHTFTTGSHHIVVFRTDLTAIPAGANGPAPCFENGSDFMSHVRGFVYAAQTPQDSFTLPDGVGFEFAPNEVLLMQSHYLNPSGADLDATVDFYVTQADSVSQTAGTLFWYDPFIYVPAGATAHAGMRCPIAQDANILRVEPHMHARGTHFRAFLDPKDGAPAAQPFYASDDWEHPAPSPAPFTVTAGTQLRIACDYDNTRGTQDFYQGQSAATNEMCVVFAVYYPDQGLTSGLCVGQGDGYGDGTATCGDLLACELACPSLSKDDLIGVSDCVQKCVVGACPKAKPQLNPVRGCGHDNCATECQTGGQTCTDCINTKCANEVAACKAATCN